MPYIVHPKDTPPTDESKRYTSRADAYREVTDGQIVTFTISEDERKEWRTREWQRFQDGMYSLPPWITYPYWCWEPTDKSEASYRYPALAHHFTHISLKSPGCVAYTKTDEDGYQDRQITIKMGRYLEEHARDYFNQKQIDEFVSIVKSYTGDLQLARTADEIERVYINGPNSCMAHGRGGFHCGKHQHPVHVFGGSDLAVAYLGTEENPSARALVWPDKKLYTRIYGDTTLKEVLKRCGYTRDAQTSHNGFPVFHGAKIRAIKVPGSSDAYVMPYLDCATGVELDEDEEWFTLFGDGRTGSYSIDETDGVAGDIEDNTHPCGNCGDRCYEEESYCSSCNDDRCFCERCSEDYFDSSDGRIIGNYWYCNRCADRHFNHTCEGCDDTWDEVHPESNYCDNCRDHYRPCNTCDEQFDTRECEDTRGRECNDCYESDEDTDEDTNEMVRIADGAVVPKYPTITDMIGVYFAGKFVEVEALHITGAIAVHRRTEVDSQELPAWTITHIPSGLVIMREVNYTRAIELAGMLSTPGIDWGFRAEYESPYATRQFARYIVRYGMLPSDLVQNTVLVPELQHSEVLAS